MKCGILEKYLSRTRGFGFTKSGIYDIIAGRGDPMKEKNRYKFIFGDKPLTLTTDKDNLFMEEVERLAREKYEAIKAKLPHADNETIAILMAINSLSVQLSREIELGKQAAEQVAPPVSSDFNEADEEFQDA